MDLGSSQSQMLLKALWNLISPLVQTASGHRKKDVDEPPAMGPEAKELLTALEKYVSCIIRVQSGQHQSGIELDLDTGAVENVECNIQDPQANSDMKDDVESDSEQGTIRDSVSIEGEAMSIGSSKDNALSPESEEQQLKQLTTRERLLDKLREHVFNNMPIRLLCFEMLGSKFKITLLERGGIYAHLAQRLLNNFDEVAFLSDPKCVNLQDAIRGKVQECAKYAILSHTWLRSPWNEVTYSDWNKGALDISQPGYQKLVNFCMAAAGSVRHTFTLGWVDTVCINKESSSELDESIRSMYQWYHQADLCMIYLADTTELSEMHKDPWFTRGWTLQELLAPRNAIFYDKVWEELGDRIPGAFGNLNDKENPEILKQIELASTITADEMLSPVAEPLSRKMQWAANRQVTREEDLAYSLMGIFNVSMSIAYGEGVERAFFRLVKKILNSSSHVLDLLNWGGENRSRGVSSLLPSTPQQYCHRSSLSAMKLYPRLPIEPLTLTHLGLRVPVLLMPAKSAEVVPSRFDVIGAYYATVRINPIQRSRHANHHWSRYNMRKIPETYKVLGKRDPIFKEDSFLPDGSGFQITLGVLNFGGNEAWIQIPKTCLAVALRYYDKWGKAKPVGHIAKIATREPILFDLQSTLYNTEGIEDTYAVKKSELARHGMQVVTLYL